METKKEYEITEINDWEGETFGYLVNLAEDEFTKISNRFNRINEEHGFEMLKIEESNLSKKEVETINNRSNNYYMERLTYRKLSKIVDLDNFEYHDFPYKGNGLIRLQNEN